MTTVEKLCADNRKLVDENLKLRKENKELRDNYDGYKAVAEPEIERLKKENAELRIKVTALENANRVMVKELDDTTSGGLSVLKNVVRSKEQLAKAKYIIKEILEFDFLPENEIKKQAEQFLSEVKK